MNFIKTRLASLLILLGIFGIFVQESQALSVNPTSGPINLNVNLSIDIQDADCTSYKINWGHGEVVEYEPGTLQTENCDTTTTTLTFSHYYLASGVYTISVLSGQSSLANLSGVPATTQVTATESTDILSISPEVGPFPLNTDISFHIDGDCTSYDLDFGDGSSHKTHAAGITNNCPSNSLKTFAHAYSQPGNYTVKLKVGNKSFNELTISDEKNIIVNGTRDSLETGVRAGKSPFTATFTALLNGRGSCAAQEYTLDYGDGNMEDISVAAGNFGNNEYCGRKTVNTTHVYENGGTFTAQLKKENITIASYIFNIGEGNNCPVITPPTCNYDQELISTGKDSNDCDTGWQCVNKDDISRQCPTAERPSCGNGKKPQSLGWRQGCYLGWECVDDNSIQPHGNQTCAAPAKPNIIQCRRDGGILIDNGRNEHGCWLGFQCNILPRDSNYNPPNNSYYFNRNPNYRGNLRNKNTNLKGGVRSNRNYGNRGSGYRYSGRGSLQSFLFSKKLRAQNSRNNALEFKSDLSKNQLKLRRGASLRERLEFLRKEKKRGIAKTGNQKILNGLFKRNIPKSQKNNNESLFERLRNKFNAKKEFQVNRQTRGLGSTKKRTFNLKDYLSKFRRYKNSE